MKPHQSRSRIHPKGEPVLPVSTTPTRLGVETFGGKIQVEWDLQTDVTAFGQLPFFIQFLKEAHLWKPWVEECPLSYHSGNAPSATDVLGTLLLSVLAGHRRYAHITAIRQDGVNPPLLGMKKILSEDAVRRAFRNCDETRVMAWMKKHLRRTYEPLLWEDYILDVDSTVKPLYGHQEGAVVGYNPKKSGRPSQVYHTYFIAHLRLVVGVEVQAGNQTASSHAQPGLWEWMDQLPLKAWPTFIRGDIGWGTDSMMKEAEKRGVSYLFKLKQTPKLREILEKSALREDWVGAGQGWQGVEDTLQLMGWNLKRRVVVLRRKVRDPLVLQQAQKKSNLPQLAFLEILGPGEEYEYAVLVTDLKESVEVIAQHYQNRGDVENNFDELKNQWGWGGYTTHDLTRCRVMSLVVALIYNWWSLFTRMVIPGRHSEAITSRPLLLHAIAKQTRHAAQKILSVTSTHGRARDIQIFFERFYRALRRISQTAEQLNPEEKYRRILSWIFQDWLDGRLLKTSSFLLHPT